MPSHPFAPPRSRRLLATLTSWALLAGTLACRGPATRGDESVQVRVALGTSPVHVGSMRVLVTVGDLTWTPVNGARVTVTGVPPDSVAAPTVRRAPGEGAGNYVIEDFPLDRAGEWSLEARVELRDGRWAEVERRVQVEDAP